MRLDEVDHGKLRHGVDDLVGLHVQPLEQCLIDEPPPGVGRTLLQLVWALEHRQRRLQEVDTGLQLTFDAIEPATN